ncbi:MAG: hypothetical protein ACRDJW_11335 [Thermomicrobiales bacterium]
MRYADAATNRIRFVANALQAAMLAATLASIVVVLAPVPALYDGALVAMPVLFAATLTTAAIDTYRNTTDR